MMNEDEYYLNPEFTGDTFEERTGDPDSFSAGIGRIVLNFSELEAQISRGIVKCLELDEKRGRIVTAEISFKNKVYILSSLIKHLSGQWKFNVGDNDTLKCWEKIEKQCFRAEEKRNQIMHSEWAGPYLRDLKANRIKYSAKAKSGLKKQIEPIDSGGMLDIADYIITVAVYVEEFFLGTSSNNALNSNTSEGDTS
jgi:hypothetical protein